MSFTNNYSIRTINETFKNFEFLEDAPSVSKRDVTIYFEVTTDVLSLHKQATLFSDSFQTHGYIDFKRVLRIPETAVKETLYNMYVYSYVKCLYNAFFSTQFSQNTDMGRSFRGHVALYRLLSSPSQHTIKDDIYISYEIILGTIKYRKALILQLISKFPFLAEFRFASIEDLGRTHFYISDYESYIDRLDRNFYSTDFIQRGEGNETFEPKKYIPYDDGKLEIFDLGKSDASSITSFGNSPIMNAFQNNSMKLLYFIPVGNGKPVKFNPSFSFDKANFIRLSSEGNDLEQIRKIYRQYNIKKTDYHLYKSEVFTNTGIKPRGELNYMDGDFNFKLPDIDELVDNLDSFLDMRKILQSILIGEFDLSEMLDDLIRQQVKSENQN